MDRFYIYLHFPTQNLESRIKSSSEGEVFLEEIQMMIDRADCQKGINLFYENDNKNRFTEIVNTMEKFDEIGNFGVANFETAINKFLYDTSEALENEHIFDETCLYRLWDITDNYHVKDALPVVLKDITERKLRDNDAKCLFLNVFDAFTWHRNIIPIFKDCFTEPTDLPKFVHINFEKDFLGLDNWLNKQQMERTYNFNDFRHIENHQNYINGKSPILGGIGGQANLAELLKNAIGDWRANKDLINFDEQNDRYAWFEDENVNNQYHGYHLAIPSSHEKDTKAENKIPNRVKSLLNYRKVKSKNNAL